MLTDELFLGTKLYHKQFEALCQPLAAYFGVTKAYYISIDHQGTVFLATTDTAWMEQSIKQQYYRVDPILVSPDNQQIGFAFHSDSEDQDFKETMFYDAKVNFQWCNNFAYVEKTPKKGLWEIGLATAKDSKQLLHRIINKAPILRRAIHDLNQRFTTLIARDLIEHRVDIKVLKGPAFYTQPGLVNEPLRANEDQLLRDINVLKPHESSTFLQPNLLSSQEVRCLRDYLDTQSIKKVASNLHLAPSTVAEYVKNIKQKFDCSSKNELINKAEILQSLGQL